MMASLLSGHWLPLVINTALQSLFVLAATAIALVCTRKASAARRHLVAVAALGALLLIPLMSLLIPGPQPLLQVSGPGLTLRRSPIRTLSASAPTRASNIASVAPTLTSTPSPLVSNAPPAAVVSPQTAPSAAHTTAASISLSRFAPWLAAFWLIGVLVVLGRLLVGYDRIRRIAQQSKAVRSETLQTGIQALLSEVGFARPLTILQASSRNPVSVAMTWGVGKATLLLPAEATQWPEERLRVVLLHELAHIRRNDWLTQMLGQFVCALYWFHPLVWLLNRHTQIEAERACDDAVLLAGVRAKEYATHLLDVIKAMQAGRNAPSAAVAMARPTQVRYRMQSILNAQRNRKSPTRSVRTLVLFVTGLLLCAVSWLRPLAWANGHKQATDPKQPPVIGPVVELPNGIAVELVAVGSDPQARGEDWWTPDGKPLMESPERGRAQFQAVLEPYGSRFLRRALFFRLRTQQKADISTTGYVVDPTQHLQTDGLHHGRNARLNGSEIRPTDAADGTVLLGFPHTDTQCTYRLGIASGPWETIATTRFALHPTPGAISIPETAIQDQTMLFLDDNPLIRYRVPGARQVLLSLLGGHAPLGDVARRVIALDKDGKEVIPQNGGFGPLESSPLPVSALSRIVEFRLQTRPYAWAEFKNIPLEHRPVAKLTPIATPPALPAFRHTYSSGITMTVFALAESRKVGGLWWQPDGKLLSGPLKDWSEVEFQGWGPIMLPRILLFQLKSPRPLAYTTAMRFAPAMPDEYDYLPSGEETPINVVNPSFTWRPLFFPQNLAHTTLRYGVAAGPWRSVASIPMPQDIRHADDTQEPTEAHLTMDIPSYPKPGELPRLHYTTSAGKVRDLPFTINDTSYLPDVARRFVAIDKAGKTFPLESDNLSQPILDEAGKPILRDPVHADMNNLRGIDYKRRAFDGAELAFHSTAESYRSNPIDLTKIREFRMEIRPYEWTEFRNIALQPTKGASAR